MLRHRVQTMRSMAQQQVIIYGNASSWQRPSERTNERGHRQTSQCNDTSRHQHFNQLISMSNHEHQHTSAVSPLTSSNAPTHQLTNSPTHQLTNNQLTNSPARMASTNFSHQHIDNTNNNKSTLRTSDSFTPSLRRFVTLSTSASSTNTSTLQHLNALSIRPQSSTTIHNKQRCNTNFTTLDTLQHELQLNNESSTNTSPLRRPPPPTTTTNPRHHELSY